jgi:hypothetical protein
MPCRASIRRVFNDYDFGGYLIANGVAPFIDGRTEPYGEKFFVDHNNASGLMEPESLFRLLEAYKIEATLMRTRSAPIKLLDHIDGWQKIYADDIATIHLQGGRGACGGAGGRSEGEVRSSPCAPPSSLRNAPPSSPRERNCAHRWRYEPSGRASKDERVYAWPSFEARRSAAQLRRRAQFQR